MILKATKHFNEQIKMCDLALEQLELDKESSRICNREFYQSKLNVYTKRRKEMVECLEEMQKLEERIKEVEN